VILCVQKILTYCYSSAIEGTRTATLNAVPAKSFTHFGMEVTAIQLWRAQVKRGSINWQKMIQYVQQIILHMKRSTHRLDRRLNSIKSSLITWSKLLRETQTFGSPCTWDDGLIQLYEGHSKSSQTDKVSHKISKSYFVTFQHRLLQLKCTWSSISTMLGFRCIRIVDLALPAGNLPCR